MKTTKHTPGPWSVLYSSNVYPSIHGKDSAPVATLYAHTPNRCEHDVFDNSEANARLIAAAPELFEALEYSLNTLTVVLNDTPDVGLLNIKAKIENAIAKARGEL